MSPGKSSSNSSDFRRRADFIFVLGLIVVTDRAGLLSIFGTVNNLEGSSIVVVDSLDGIPCERLLLIGFQLNVSNFTVFRHGVRDGVNSIILFESSLVVVVDLDVSFLLSGDFIHLNERNIKALRLDIGVIQEFEVKVGISSVDSEVVDERTSLEEKRLHEVLLVNSVSANKLEFDDGGTILLIVVSFLDADLHESLLASSESSFKSANGNLVVLAFSGGRSSRFVKSENSTSLSFNLDVVRLNFELLLLVGSNAERVSGMLDSEFSSSLEFIPNLGKSLSLFRRFPSISSCQKNLSNIFVINRLSNLVHCQSFEGN